MDDISFVKKKKIQSFNHARIEAIDRINGRVSLSMRNGLVSTGTYLYDLNDLREGMTVLVGKLDGSYVIIEKVTGNPRLGGAISMTKYVSPIGENWRFIRSLPVGFDHLYYLGNDTLITSDSFWQNPPVYQARSIDRGETWTITEVQDYPGKSGIVNLGNGVLIARYDEGSSIFFPEYEVIHKIIRSTDYGVTWQSVWDIPLTGEGLNYGNDVNGFYFCNLRDGHVVFYTTYMEERYIGYGGYRTIGALSSDYGATWTLEVHPPATGPYGYGYSVNCWYMKPGYGWGYVETKINGSSPENIIDSHWIGGNHYPFIPPGGSSWIEDFLYSERSFAYDDEVLYRCLLEHTSSNSTKPGSGIYWRTYWVVQVVGWLSVPSEYGVFARVVQVNDNLAYLYKSTGEMYVSTDDGRTWTQNTILPVPAMAYWTDDYYSDNGTILIETPNDGGWAIRGNQVSKGINECFGHDKDHSVFWVEGSIWMAKGRGDNLDSVYKSTNNGLNWRKVDNNGNPFTGCREIVNMGNGEFIVTAYAPTPGGGSSFEGIWKSTPSTLPCESLFGNPNIPLDNWVTDVFYMENEWVSIGGYAYVAMETHTSDSSTEPGVGANWEFYWILVGSYVSWAEDIYFLASVMEPGGYVLCYKGSYVNLYICIAEHTSSSSNEPGEGVDWETYWMFVPMD